MADTSKIVTGSSLAYFKEKQDIFNAGKFVAQETDKGLSTNDFTDDLKSKLEDVETGAQVNKLEGVKLNGSAVAITDKIADLGTIATSEELEVLEGKVDAVEEDITGIEEDIVDINSAIDNIKDVLLPEKNVIVEKLGTAEEDFLATYVVKQNGVKVGASINIPKDFLVKRASVKRGSECVPAQEPADHLFIDFVINTKEDTGTDEHIFIDVHDLVDVYTAGDGIVIENNVISVDAAEIPTIEEVEEAIEEAVGTEETRALAAEGALETAINSEVSRAQGKETELNTAIANEASRADTAEKANAKAISDEETRAKAAEQANANAITKEVGDRETADTALSGRINTLESDVAGAIPHAAAKGSAVNGVLGKVTSNAEGHVTAVAAATYSDLPIEAEDLINTLGVVAPADIDEMFPKE